MLPSPSAAAWIATCLVLLVAACGSTVRRGDPGAPTVAAGPTAGTGVASPATGLAATAPSVARPPGATGTGASSANPASSPSRPAPGGGTTSSGAPQGQPGTAAGGTSQVAPSPGAQAPGPQPAAPAEEAPGPGGLRPVAPGVLGIDDTTITLGLEYNENTSAVNEAAGINNATGGNPRFNFETLIEWINGRGGVAGRQLAAAYFVNDAAQGETNDQREQAKCETFGQDTPTYAVNILGTLNYVACLHQYPMALLNTGGLSIMTESTYAEFPRYMETNALSLQQLSAIYAPGLDTAGFFEPEAIDGAARVGFITYDLPTFVEAVETALVPGMASVGKEFTDIRYIPWVGSQSDIGAAEAAIANAVLRFRSENIDHVMLIDISGFLHVLFMQTAENQGYRPQYGLNSTSFGNLAAGSGIIPTAQLENARQVGSVDLVDTTRENWAPNPARDLCRQIMSDAGNASVETDVNSLGIALGHCDFFFALQAGVEASSGPITASSVQEGLEALGDTFTTGFVGPVRFAPDRHFGVTSYRPGAWLPECPCFEYTGPAVAIP